ncbi:hypothetical protein Ac2012v2_007568 [Leucoagaricus gongylophorus]
MDGLSWKRVAGKEPEKAMIQLHGMANEDNGEDYPWEEYATLIVDIGGGMGSLEEMPLSVLQNKELTFTIFDIDIEKTIDNSTKARQHDLNLHFLV